MAFDTPTRLAATTLILRPQDTGFQVLMVRRSLQASFMPGSHVFPGGAVDDSDAHADLLTCCDETADEAAQRLAMPRAIDHLVAALRECYEECGLWLGETAVAHPEAPRWRERLRRGEASLAEASRALGLRLSTRALAPWSHWVTPIDLPKRFDTRFFVALAPAGQEPSVDDAETIALRWVAPMEALALHEAGGFSMEFATRETLRSLAAFSDVDALMAHARQPRVLEPHHPRAARDGRGGRIVILPTHHAYAEVQRLDPAGTTGAVAALLPGEPVRLAPMVWRLTAPNPGVMTGPGTNTYLVGREGRYLVIDPGPRIEAHVDAIMQATGGHIDALLVTHTHVDHSPAAARLAELTGARRVGLPPPLHGRHDGGFDPDIQPADGQVVEAAGVQLEAVHTPGHASNHVCWWLAEEGMLFTGDHLMQGSTVVIDPPDGDMTVYLRSLRMLPQRLPGLAWLAPGHGFLIGQPERAIDRLIAHRLAREDKVRRALAACGAATLDELLPHVYDDVPAGRHPVARRSLLAHLLKLRDEGLASEEQGRWRESRSIG